MMLQHEKFVLTGGKLSGRTLDDALEISGIQRRNLVIDTSPKVSPEAYEKSRSVLTKWLAEYGKVSPVWLDAEQPHISHIQVNDSH